MSRLKGDYGFGAFEAAFIDDLSNVRFVFV